MSNPKKEFHYNPEHPAAIDNLKASIHPAGVLMRFAVQVALTGITHMKDLPIPTDDEWAELGTKCKKISRVAGRVGRDLLAMGHKWELSEFIQCRCSDILGDGPKSQAVVMTDDMLDEDIEDDWSDDVDLEDAE
jgi:hypothetical protein